MNPSWPFLIPKEFFFLASQKRPFHGSIYLGKNRNWRAFSSDGFSAFAKFRDTGRGSQEDAPKSSSTPLHPAPLRVNWKERTHSHDAREPSAMVRKRFSSQQYVSYSRELLKGLWSLSSDPLWILVDQLVAAGKPYDMHKTCPEFPHWKHIVEAPDLAAAVSALASQGNLRVPEFGHDGEEGDDEFFDDTSAPPVPTWLVVYMLSAKIDTRAAAHEGLAFCLSQLERTPTHLRVPLLVLSMCSLSAHGLAAQVPALLESFLDVCSCNQTDVGGPDVNAAENHDQVTHSLGSSDTVIYLYNVFLTLLTQFPYVPQLSMRVERLLRHMHARGVPIEVDTAKHLITSRLASSFLVRTVRHILEQQNASHNCPEQLDGISISMTRFFSKRRNRKEAEKYLDTARGISPLDHAKTYLLSFRDVAASLSYIRVLEEEHEHETTVERGSDAERKGSLAWNLKRRRSRMPESTTHSITTAPPMRHIYTSMLFTIALNKTVSTATFRSLYDSIRAAHGADKVLETVALVGLLKRKAWDEAKELWGQWQAESESLRVKHTETLQYFQRRQQLFGDAEDVKKTVGWTDFKEYLLKRLVYRMKVDATALAVAVHTLAGQSTADLLEAFEVMDGFAIKVGDHAPSFDDGAPQPPAPDSLRAVNISNKHQPHDVRLTSRVLNSFMSRALHLRRPDIVFRLWDGMTPYYGVDTSVSTLNTLLRSARVATSMESSLSRVIPDWLKRGISRDFLGGSVAFPDLSDEIRWMLSPDCKPGMRWNGTPAWRVARRVFREDILFANWPWLRDVKIPAQAVRGDAAMSRIDALKELAMDDGLGHTGMGGMGNYPHIVPSMRNFKEYVFMLGRVQRSSEIPEVLAWMKALEVRPSRRMLSLCLASWAEVGLGSPADDVWVEGVPERSHNEQGVIGGKLKHGGEYGKLITWLEEWVGKEVVPDDAEALDSLRYIRALEEAESIRY